MNRRNVGRTFAALAGGLSFSCAAWAAHSSALPEFRVYDGYWMILGATLATLLVAPVVWRWPRELSLIAIAVSTVMGILAPLVISALRLQMPIRARLLGSWVLGGADMVGPALIIGFMSLWFALREYRARGSRSAPGSTQ